MPVISEKYSFIFICTPGTGSTSYSQFFLNNAEGKWLPSNDILMPNGSKLDYKHASINELVDNSLIEKEVLSSFFKFTFVRNPYSWLLSDYKRHQTWASLLLDKKSWIQSDEPAKKRVRLALSEDFFGYVFNRLNRGDIFRKYVAGCDDVFRIEDVNKEKYGPKQRLSSLNWKKLRFINKTNANTSLLENELLFTPEVIELISVNCRDTFFNYGYPISFEKMVKYF